MTRRLMRAPDGTRIPYGLTCDHLWRGTGLGYYAVFRPGEEQADCYCEECYGRLRQGQKVGLWHCCLCCAETLLANHRLVEEIEVK